MKKTIGNKVPIQLQHFVEILKRIKEVMLKTNYCTLNNQNLTFFIQNKVNFLFKGPTKQELINKTRYIPYLLTASQLDDICRQ